MHLDGEHVALDHFQRSGTDIDRSLFLHSRVRTHGILGGIGGHILLDPGHGGTFSTILVEARVVDPGSAMDISPQGDAGAIGSLPHQRQNLLVLRLLLGVVCLVDIQLGDVHRHVEGILLLLKHIAQLGGADVAQFVRLVAVGIDRSSGIAQRLHQCDVVVDIPPDRVVVVVNLNGIGPTLASHIEGLDEPVEAGLSATAQRLLHHGVAILVPAHGLVHHVDEGQGVIFRLHVIEPIGDGGEALLWRQVGQPVGILRTPHQRVELVGEVVLLGIVERPIAAPVEISTVSLYRPPFRLVLAGNLVPEFVIQGYAATGFHIAPCGDVAQELVGVGG